MPHVVSGVARSLQGHQTSEMLWECVHPIPSHSYSFLAARRFLRIPESL